jgi:FlxA-like protein
MPQWRTVLPIAAVVAMSAVAAVVIVVALDSAEGLSPGDTSAPGLEAQVRSLRSELEATKQQLQSVGSDLKRTKRQLAEQRRLEAQLRRLTKELALADGEQTCSASQTPQVSVEILEPELGEVVSAPVVVHLLVTDPLGCEATYYLSVDGEPYAHDESEGGKGTPSNPFPYSPRPQGDFTDACVSNVFSYVALELDPGTHTLQVNGGCSQGTGVPDTIPTSVTFTVAEPG